MYIHLGPFLTQLYLALKINIFHPVDSTFLSSKSINKSETHLFENVKVGILDECSM